jgi:hypothetical protein
VRRPECGFPHSPHACRRPARPSPIQPSLFGRIFHDAPNSLHLRQGRHRAGAKPPDDLEKAAVEPKEALSG